MQKYLRKIFLPAFGQTAKIQRKLTKTLQINSLFPPSFCGKMKTTLSQKSIPHY